MMPTNDAITVAVIDSGAHVPHPHLPSIAGGVGFDLKGVQSDDITDRLGHGTAAAAAIHEKAPAAAIHVVKVFDQQLATTVPTLIRAIDWSIEHGMQIVNLSLGTAHDFREDELRPVVGRAVDAGVLLVSAHEFESQLWFPGSMPGAVGVVMDADQPRERIETVESTSGRVLRASPFPRPVPGVPPDRNLNGISFAVANASGCLAALLVDRPDVRTEADVLAAFTM